MNASDADKLVAVLNFGSSKGESEYYNGGVRKT